MDDALHYPPQQRNMDIATLALAATATVGICFMTCLIFVTLNASHYIPDKSLKWMQIAASLASLAWVLTSTFHGLHSSVRLGNKLDLSGKPLIQTAQQLDVLGATFQYLSSATIIYVHVRLILDVHELCWNVPRKGARVILIVTRVLAIVIALISFAALGAFEYYYKKYNDLAFDDGVVYSSPDTEHEIRELETLGWAAQLVSQAVDVLLFGLTIMTIGLTLQLVLKARSTSFQTIAHILNASVILLFIRHAYEFAISIPWKLMMLLDDDDEAAPPYWLSLTTIIFLAFTVLGNLILVWRIGRRNYQELRDTGYAHA